MRHLRTLLFSSSGLVVAACASSAESVGGTPPSDAGIAMDAALPAPDAGTNDAQAGPGDAGEEADAGVAVLAAGAASCAASLSPDTATAPPPYSLLGHGAPISDKAFYLATLLYEVPGVADDLATDAVVAATNKSRDDAYRSAAASCDVDLACYGAKLGFTDAAATAIANASADALAKSGKLGPLVDQHLRGSRLFALYADGPDHDVLVRAIHDVLLWLSSAFATYGKELGAAGVKEALSASVSAHPSPTPFWGALYDVDQRVMAADGRDEGVRHDPLETTENAKALARVAKVDFSAFPYSAIVVPGQGPGNKTTVLDPTGQKRCDLAVLRYQAKLSPFVLTSGGHVHPDRTAYAEALEMKKYLLTQGIPEEAILVDPYARHTTTNLRNATRLLARAGFPLDRPALITSDTFQAIYIGYWGADFGPRCQKELGYLPWRLLVPLTTYDSCMLPSSVTLHAAGSDALDP